MDSYWSDWETRPVMDLPLRQRIMFMDRLLGESNGCNYRNINWEKGVWFITDDYLFGKSKYQFANHPREGTPMTEDTDFNVL